MSSKMKACSGWHTGSNQEAFSKHKGSWETEADSPKDGAGGACGSGLSHVRHKETSGGEPEGSW